MQGTERFDASALEALDADSWAWLLPHIRRALDSAAGELDGSEVQLAGLPAGRLAGGRARRSLCELIASNDAVAAALVEEIDVEEDVPGPIAALLAAGAPAATDTPPGESAPQRPRDQQRVRRLREQRDEARRRAEGADARARGLEAEVQRLNSRLEAMRTEVADLGDRLAEAEQSRRRAVERERRRRDAEIEQLKDELAGLRRERDARGRAAARRPASEAQPEGRRRPEVTRVVPGRPTELPDGVDAMTTEAARLLMNRGRLVLVDGYNVSLEHQPALDLQRQRRWVVQLATNAAQRLGVRPTVVFDGEHGGAGAPSPARHGVRVRFTDGSITADDDIVFEVEATDEPVLVVTDDRELAQRVRASRGDVIATAPFVWASR